MFFCKHCMHLKLCMDLFLFRSMKKGQIINITHSLPPECPFKSYKEMKAYWRATVSLCFHNLLFDHNYICNHNF